MCCFGFAIVKAAYRITYLLSRDTYLSLSRASVCSMPTSRRRITTLPFTGSCVSRVLPFRRTICGSQPSCCNIPWCYSPVTLTLMCFLSSPAYSSSTPSPAGILGERKTRQQQRHARRQEHDPSVRSIYHTVVRIRSATPVHLLPINAKRSHYPLWNQFPSRKSRAVRYRDGGRRIAVVASPPRAEVGFA